MIEFFHTKDRLRFLLYVGAIAAPLLLISAWVVSSMEDSAAAKGEPNDKGGLHYRIQEKSGAKTLPPPLAALLSVPPNTAMTDVNVSTDSAGRVTSAAIKAFSTDDFKAVAAFHKPTLSPITTDGATSLEGVRDGYEIRLSQETKFFDNDPYKDRTKIEYTINPVKKP
ncbi:hypothetical protein [Variovorax sp. PAMC26660]|uniref:hypothetical protein n=1 Tax=Variovorax sp. PAMC26660 TaxID=2762322 RepID=UPI00164E2AE8|nr:hypothetical protein [Variovorax sp. PAMC26660]QNK69433.1 hypothetical protein H7F35_06955 [Variovorax sp. PAMC26660]